MIIKISETTAINIDRLDAICYVDHIDMTKIFVGGSDCPFHLKGNVVDDVLEMIEKGE